MNKSTHWLKERKKESPKGSHLFASKDSIVFPACAAPKPSLHEEEARKKEKKEGEEKKKKRIKERKKERKKTKKKKER